MKRFKQIIFYIFLIFIFISLVKNIFDYKNKYQFYTDYKRDYDNEKKKNIELQTEIVKKKSLTEVEKTIRNKLNLVKKNEVAIILPTPIILISPTPTPIPPPYQQWWNLFFK